MENAGITHWRQPLTYALAPVVRESSLDPVSAAQPFAVTTPLIKHFVPTTPLIQSFKSINILGKPAIRGDHHKQDRYYPQKTPTHLAPILLS